MITSTISLFDDHPPAPLKPRGKCAEVDVSFDADGVRSVKALPLNAGYSVEYEPLPNNLYRLVLRGIFNGEEYRAELVAFGVFGDELKVSRL